MKTIAELKAEIAELVKTPDITEKEFWKMMQIKATKEQNQALNKFMDMRDAWAKIRALKSIIDERQSLSASIDASVAGCKYQIYKKPEVPGQAGNKEVAGMKKKPKLAFYCDNPACFAHYVANHKIKVQEKPKKEQA